MSELSIEAGQRWNEQISKRLQDTHFGILCITPENRDSRWLHFEAGALAKALDVSRVVPVLFDMRKVDLTFPLAQFQAVEANREGFFAVVSALNRALGEHQLSGPLLGIVFDNMWASLESSLSEIQPFPSESVISGRSDREILEELLEGVRSLHREDLIRSPIQDYVDWEDYVIQGANLANLRGGQLYDLEALRAYSEAIALIPAELSNNTRARLYTYRGAMFKRLRRLEEAQQDLILAEMWAEEAAEVNDVLYNLASVAALSGKHAEAITLLQKLLARDAGWLSIIENHTEYFGTLMDEPDFRALGAGLS